MINIIAAVSLNNCIGVNNSIPWKIKEDMQLFKKLTTNNTIIMGRKTFESIGKPLPNRKNIVISSSKIENIETYKSLEESLNNDGNIFLIGGSKIYQEGMKYANKMYITLVNKVVEGDTFFPFIGPEWKCISKFKLTDEASLLEYCKL